jgi:chromosome partitioning protein
MAYVISVVNQKGGVGKTTTVVHLSSALARLGYPILVVDLDPQANVSTTLDVHFISSLPVGSQPACMAWEDRKRAQSVEGGG